MSIHENLNVPYHQQDTDYYCGAACAQMVLAQTEVGAGLLGQDPLYADNHSHSTTDAVVSWYSGPDGLQWTMNDRRPAGFTNPFVLFDLNTEDGISRKIVWTIHHYQVAPIAMVFGLQHWIVVRGYDASAAPTNSGDTSYTINAFDVNNPWPPCPSWYNPALAPPPPHGGADGCGTGGNRGVANQHISYATWQSTYMTGVPKGYWAGKYLAVCDPEPPPDRVGQQRPVPRRLPGERLIEREEAVKFALAGLEEYNLYQREQWKSVLEGTQPGNPMLVKHLDRNDSYYYVVPMENKARHALALVSVDARFGNYCQALSLPESQMPVVPTLEPEQLLEMTIGRRFELEDRLGRVLVRPEAVCVYPTLVWKPCRESLSPFWPFHMISVGAHRLYVRGDGAVFTQLHDDKAGI